MLVSTTNVLFRKYDTDMFCIDRGDAFFLKYWFSPLMPMISAKNEIHCEFQFLSYLFTYCGDVFMSSR